VCSGTPTALFPSLNSYCDVFDAITWVGFPRFISVVAKLASQTLQLPKGACGIDVDKLWHHSAVTGVIAGAIAKRAQETKGWPSRRVCCTTSASCCLAAGR